MATTEVPTQETGIIAPVEETEENLLAGKYKTTEALEEAYKALERKLGSAEMPEKTDAQTLEGEQQQQQESTEDTPNTATTEQPSNNFTVTEKTDEQKSYERDTYGEALAGLFDNAKLDAKAVGDHYQQTGQFPEEAYQALEQQGFSKNVIDNYLEGVNAQNKVSAELAQKDVSAIKTLVGGEAEYSKMAIWASQNLDEAEQQSFNEVLATGNKAAISWAVQALHAKFTNNMGSEPKMKGGKQGDAVGVYRSHYELTKDMQDVRYQKGDPAFHQQVQDKLARSNIFNRS